MELCKEGVLMLNSEKQEKCETHLRFLRSGASEICSWYIRTRVLCNAPRQRNK